MARETTSEWPGLTTNVFCCASMLLRIWEILYWHLVNAQLNIAGSYYQYQGLCGILLRCMYVLTRIRWLSVMIWISYPELATWWRHQMETFSAYLAICAGNSPVPGEFLAQRPVTRSFDVFFDQRLNKRLSKQWWGWWFETLSCPLWRQCNEDNCRPQVTNSSTATFHPGQFVYAWPCNQIW